MAYKLVHANEGTYKSLYSMLANKGHWKMVHVWLPANKPTCEGIALFYFLKTHLQRVSDLLTKH